MKDRSQIIGLMSGTSLDGIDLAYCRFDHQRMTYDLLASDTYPYSSDWKDRLRSAHEIPSSKLIELERDLSELFAVCIDEFIKKHEIDKNELNAISSHGHTVLHQPSYPYTLQIVRPADLAALTGITVIGDYRSADISLGGQGAPLVPIGDRLLFKEFDSRVNIGGFVNISYEDDKNDTIAYDVCPANIVLNSLASELSLEYDKGGESARKGRLNKDLLNELDRLEYYSQSAPKSLGKEWVVEHIDPILENYKIGAEDRLNTFCEHIAIQLAQNIQGSNALLCGGGALNDYLVERISFHSKAKVVLGDIELINFKEAIIFAFLGHLRLNEEINVLKTVTGASRDHCAGSIHLGSVG